MKKPKIGDRIYIDSSYYVFRGEDDFSGGKATIDKIDYSKNLPEDHCNYIMVGVEENEGTMYNYKNLMKEQKTLKKEFGDQIAHPDPDLREEFNCPDSDWK